MASARPEDIEVLLLRSAPFESAKVHEEGEDASDIRERQQTRTFWVTGEKGLTEAEAAKKIVEEAREVVTKELGLPDGVWSTDAAAAVAAAATAAAASEVSKRRKSNRKTSNHMSFLQKSKRANKSLSKSSTSRRKSRKSKVLIYF